MPNFLELILNYLVTSRGPSQSQFCQSGIYCVKLAQLHLSVVLSPRDHFSFLMLWRINFKFVRSIMDILVNFEFFRLLIDWLSWNISQSFSIISLGHEVGWHPGVGHQVVWRPWEGHESIWWSWSMPRRPSATWANILVLWMTDRAQT